MLRVKLFLLRNTVAGTSSRQKQKKCQLFFQGKRIIDFRVYVKQEKTHNFL